MVETPKSILLVEDDENDVFFLTYAFEAAGVVNPVVVARDGQEAMEYLGGVGRFSDRSRHPFPGLVLLDLKLPVKTGLDVLRWIRQSGMRNLLVIVLTSSKDPHDVDEAYRLGARSFLVKPLTISERLETAKVIKRYWLELNQLPSTGPAAATTDNSPPAVSGV
jgi:CheY-like chemotaxis protein